MAYVVPYLIMTVISVAVGFAMQAMQKPIEGAKLGDIAKQTAKEGGARLIVWGIVRPIGGNVVACSDPKKVTTSSGGKGGGGGQTQESVYRTYAIGICEGPITGIRRVWRNNKLVYDSRTDDAGDLNTWGAANNPVFLQKATFYLGDYAQLPDPSLEGIFGIGEVPAMRGTCYMVMNNENLTELGGAVPQFIFEVVRAEGVSLTSQPYPLESEGEIATSNIDLLGIDFRNAINSYTLQTESITTTDVNLIGMNIRSPLLSYIAEVEGINTTEINLNSLGFRSAIIAYDSGTDSIETSSINLIGLIIRDALITYSHEIPEELKTTNINITGINHGN